MAVVGSVEVAARVLANAIDRAGPTVPEMTPMERIRLECLRMAAETLGMGIASLTIRLRAEEFEKYVRGE